MYYGKKVLIKQVDGGYIVRIDYDRPGEVEQQYVRDNLCDMLDVVAEYFVASPLPNAVAVEPLSERKENDMPCLTVKIVYNEPRDPSWLNADNVALALHAYCKNTKFEVLTVVPWALCEGEELPEPNREEAIDEPS